MNNAQCESPILWLDQLQWSDQPQIGSKALILSQLGRRGYPVPSGFVIPASCLRSFLEQVRWPDELFTDFPYSTLRINTEDSYQLQHIAKHLQLSIVEHPLPEVWVGEWEQAIQGFRESHVILRPCLVNLEDYSLPIETTGVLEAVICQKRSANFATSLKQLWASLFRAKSLVYWQNLDIELSALPMAVLVQPLQAAIAAGTVQIRPQEVIVEATRGLAVSITRGEVVPDRYRFDRQRQIIIEQQLGRKVLAYGYPQPENPALSIDAEHTLEIDQIPFWWLNATEQDYYALTRDQVHQLVQQALELVTELGPQLDLEWVLSPDRGDPDQVDSNFGVEHDLPGEPYHFLWLQAEPKIDMSETPTITKSQVHLQGEAAAPGYAIGRVLRYTQNSQDSDFATLITLQPSNVLIIKTLTPTIMPVLDKMAGVVIEQGGLTSHGAILARELQIPAVVGIPNATQQFYPGAWVAVDGDRGEVYAIEPDSTQTLSSPSPTVQASPLALDHLASHWVTGTQVFVTVSHPATVSQLNTLAVDGIGLIRSEWLFFDLLENQHPRVWLAQGRGEELADRLAARLQLCIEAIRPRPLSYRSFDFRAREFKILAGLSDPGALDLQGASLQGASDPQAVALLDGTLRTCLEPEVFKLELSILQRLQDLGSPVRLLLPFIRTVEEFVVCRTQVQAMGLLNPKSLSLWIMAEVPSVLFLLAEYVQAGVQGIAIGSNDLTQFLLAMDREQASNPFYQSDHVVIQRAIVQLIQDANRLQIPCSICGQLPTLNPDLLQDWIAAGLSAVSVEVAAIARIRYAIAQAEQFLVLKAAREQLSHN